MSLLYEQMLEVAKQGGNPHDLLPPDPKSAEEEESEKWVLLEKDSEPEPFHTKMEEFKSFKQIGYFAVTVFGMEGLFSGLKAISAEQKNNVAYVAGVAAALAEKDAIYAAFRMQLNTNPEAKAIWEQALGNAVQTIVKEGKPEYHRAFADLLVIGCKDEASLKIIETAIKPTDTIEPRRKFDPGGWGHLGTKRPDDLKC